MTERIDETLRLLNWTDKYKAKFEDEGVDDEVMDEWLQNQQQLKDLGGIIPPAGARAKFLKQYKALSSASGSQSDPQAQTPEGKQDEVVETTKSDNAAENSPSQASSTSAAEIQINNVDKNSIPSFQLPDIPEPIQIIEFKEIPHADNSTKEKKLELVLHKDRLWAILKKVGKRQISILSIAGPSRKGKSFILGFMLRYLKSIQKSNESDDDDNVTSDWMGWKRPDEPLTGFSWRNGYERETSGILMWSEPFNVTSCDGREFSIILMDTQGVFDEHTSQREWSTIVGLSLLTSACLIFNIFTDLQEESLQALENFMTFGLLAVDTKENEGENQSTIKPFQRLTFLIRDWNNPDEFPYGEKGGRKFLDKKLEIKSSHLEDHKRIRQQLHQCFDQLECFLMPEPGANAKKVDYSGCLSGLDQKFAKNVEKFISSLLNIDEFPIKSIGGNFVTGVELFTYFENYVEIFKSEETPKPKSLYDVTILALFSSLIDKTFTLYTTEISKQLRKKRFFSNHELEAIHNSAMGKAIDFFGKSRKIGNAEDSQRNKDKVVEKMKEHFEKVKEKNFNERKTAADEGVKDSLEKFNNSIQVQIKNANIDPDDCFDDETIDSFINAAEKSALQNFFEALNIEAENEENQDEFQEHQLQLENLISKSSEDIKQTNQLQRSHSDGILREEVEKLLKDYKDKINSQIENKFIPAKQLENTLESANKETIKSFQSRSQFTLYKQFKDKLLEKILLEQDQLNKVAEKEREKIILEVEKKSSEMSKQSRDKLSQLKGIDLEKFTGEYENQREIIIQEFENFLQLSFFGCIENESEDETKSDGENECDDKNQSDAENKSGVENESEDKSLTTKSDWQDETNQLKKNYADKLLIEIQENFENLKSQLALRLDSILQSISDKESEAIKIYTTAMDNFLQSYEACPDDQLESTHTGEKIAADSFLSSALDEIIQKVKLTQDSDKENEDDKIDDSFINKINETKVNFDEKCEKQFQDYKDRCNLQREYQESKAKNDLSNVEKFYSTELKKIADSVKTQDEFDQLEEQIKEDTRKELESKLDKNLNPLLKEELEEKLEESMRDCYNNTLEYLKMKLEEDKVAIEGALIAARKHYNSEMEKYLSSSSFVHPKQLEDLSEKTLNAAVDLSKKTAVLTPGQEQQLRDEMTLCFRKFQDQNYMKVPMKDPAIGIDLGTTYCCVAAYLNGSVKIIPNTQGKNTTPSYVSFSSDGSMCIGEPAKDKAHVDPKNTIFDAKRLIGRKFDDPVVQNDIKLWPFEVVNEMGVVQIKAQGKLYHPEQISSYLLAYLKECAEKKLGVEIKKAVITVPAYFKDGQKEATRHAGELAGLEVLKIINEPTAAAMAYKLDYADESHRNVLIFDLGGGTFDVAVVTINGGHLGVKALDGDTHLGGEDFDNEMVSFCVDSFKAETGIDLTNQTKALDPEVIYRTVMRMRSKCESKKINLSSTQKETVEADVIVPGHDLSVPITRQQFEKMNQEHFDKCLEIVEKVLKDAGLDKGQIDDIVMVGGSTRIPKIQEMLTSFFGGKALNHRVNPDEAVAVGAAMQASLLNAKQGDYLKKIISSINDVTPHSIGVEISDLTLSVIIPKNSRIPCREVRPYTTAKDNQTSVDVRIFEGEKTIALENHELGLFKLDGIPAAKKEEEIVDVSMEIDVDGLLTVTATSRGSRSSANISVSTQKGRLDKDSIQKLRDSTAEQMKNRRESNGTAVNSDDSDADSSAYVSEEDP